MARGAGSAAHVAALLLLLLPALVDGDQCTDQCAMDEADAAEISDPRFLSTFLKSLRGKYAGEGVTLQFVDFQQAFMKQSLVDFCAVAGCRPALQVTNNANWYDDVSQDLRSAKICDGYIFNGAWMPDFASIGLLDKLTDRIRVQSSLNWLDVYPSVRDSALFKEDVYMVPLDGDVIQAVYRLDLLEGEGMAAPKTFAEFAEASEFFHGKDLNGDNVPDYGICFSTAANDIGGQLFWAAMAPFLQTKGSAEGVFFDPDTMSPKMEEPIFKEAMRIYKRLVLASPYSEDGIPKPWRGNNDLFLAGRCAFYFNFPGPVKIVISGQEASGLGGKLGVVKLPGVACADCPHASRDGVTYAPFYAGGGASGMIRASADEVRKEIVFDYLSWLSDPEIGYLVVSDPGTLLDPFRLSHVAGLGNSSSVVAQAFLARGWEERQLVPLRDLVADVFSSPNAAMDLRVPGGEEYTEGQTMPYLISYWAGEASLDQTVANMVAAWNGITAKYGLANQRRFYRSSLGLGPFTPPLQQSGEEDTVKVVLITIGVAAGAVLVAVAVWAVVRRIRHALKAERENRRTNVDGARKNFADLTRLTCNMVLISRKNFEHAGRFVSFEEARDSGIHVNLDTYEQARQFCWSNHVVFISHQWLGGQFPDPEGVQFQASKTALEGLAKDQDFAYDSTYVWIDYSSIPQRNKMVLHMAIGSIQVYATLPKYFICLVVDATHEFGHRCGPATYLDRGWCRLEQWARVSVGGLHGVYTYSSLGGLQALSSQSQFVQGIENWFEVSIRVCEGNFTDPEDKHRLKGVITALWMYAVLTKDADGVVYSAVQKQKQAVFPPEIFRGKAIEIAEQVCDELSKTNWKRSFQRDSSRSKSSL